MLNHNVLMSSKLTRLAVLLTSGLGMASACAQETGDKVSPPAGNSVVAGNPSRYRPNRFSKRATSHYGLIWGVDSLSVKWVESGEII